ncbi:MAG: FkbM family methyltransferase [Anaerolineae bacterium]|nr:FkbM family methyltransferase [Anaerolineae bacterium]
MKQIVHTLLKQFNRQLRSFDDPTRSFSRGFEILRKLISPSTIIDVGVADGTPELYKSFPNHPYLLIEANPTFREQLNKTAAGLDAVIEYVFCGDQMGETALRVYKDPRKSSTFQINRDLQLETILTVPVNTLDHLVEKHRLNPPYLVKIDVEGAEKSVLEGAVATLKKTEAVIAEASVLPKFKGGTSFAELVHLMDAQGFSVFDIWAGANHPQTQYLYQVDLVFVKTNASFRYLSTPE